MAAEVEVPPHSIAAAAVLKAVPWAEGRWRLEEEEVALGRGTLGAELVRERAGLVRKWVGQQSRGHSLEEAQCEGERIPAQQG